MKIFIQVILGLNYFFLSPTYGQSNRVDIVLEKYFNAVGGRTQWENITTRIDKLEMIQGKNPDDLFSEQRYTKCTRLYKRINDSTRYDRFIIVPINNTEDTFSTCFNGKLWMHRANSKPENFDGIKGYNEKYQKKIRWGYPSNILLADSITYSDSLSLMDDMYDVLEIHTPDDSLFYYFSKEDFLIHKSLYYSKSNDKVTTHLKDYRRVQGRLVAFIEESYRNGDFDTRTKYSEIRFNVELDNTFYKIPTVPPYYILTRPIE